MKRLIILTSCLLLLVGCGKAEVATVTNKAFEKDDIIYTTEQQTKSLSSDNKENVEQTKEIETEVVQTTVAPPDFSMTAEEIGQRIYDMEVYRYEESRPLSEWVKFARGKERYFVGAYYHWLTSSRDGDWVASGENNYLGSIETASESNNSTDYQEAYDRCGEFYLDYERAMVANPNALTDIEEQRKEEIDEFYGRLAVADKEKEESKAAKEASMAALEAELGDKIHEVTWNTQSYYEADTIYSFIGGWWNFPGSSTPVELQIGEDPTGMKYYRVLFRYNDDSGEYIFCEVKQTNTNMFEDEHRELTTAKSIADCAEYFKY